MTREGCLPLEVLDCQERLSMLQEWPVEEESWFGLGPSSDAEAGIRLRLG